MYNKPINKLTLDTTTGYLYFIDINHPLATGNAGRVLYHRHIYSIYINRWIKPTEIVHHINHNKLDNIINNLELLSASEHGKQHALDKGFKITSTISCKECNKSFKQKETEQEFCSSICSSKFQVKNKAITKELLEELIPTMTWVQLGILFNYSDVGIKKRAKSLGCKLK